MERLLMENFQESSEIALFNEIGGLGETLGYEPKYFKVLWPKMIETENGFEIIRKYMHYIHLCKDEQIKISIYYDKYNIGAMFPEQPYFELYDFNNDIERFLDIEEDKNNLLNRVSELMR